MAVRIQSKNDEPTMEDLKKLKKYAEDAEKYGFKVAYSNDPGAVLTLTSKSSYEQKLTKPDLQILLSLPDHLRKTALTVRKLGEVTADEVAKRTNRARAVESGYLNQLVVMGHLKKKRVGRKAYFYVEG